MSPFAEALKGLLDDTNLFNRREWAEIFLIKEYVIEEWLTDVVLPKPYVLGMLVIALETALDVKDVKKEPLDRFKDMAKRPSTEVSEKFGKLMLPTVQEYIDRPAFCELSSKLAKLSLKEREKLLETLYQR